MTQELDLQAEIARLVDRAAITELIDRYAKLFDDRVFGTTLPLLFTEDAYVEPSSGSHQGLDGLGKLHGDVTYPFGPTQHLFTNTLVDITGDQAAFRTNTYTYVTHTVLSETKFADQGVYFLAGGTPVAPCFASRVGGGSTRLYSTSSGDRETAASADSGRGLLRRKESVV
jgi:hypothetical protein